LPNGAHGQLVAVAFSAYTTRRHQEMATAAGFDLFIGKPIAPPDFVAAIARVIAQRR
jgi:CheY-like chemotaxis protein